MKKKYKNHQVPTEPAEGQSTQKRSFGSRRLWVTIAIAAAVLIIGGAGLFVMTRSPQPIPSSVSKQLSFSPFALSPSRANGATAKSFRYDKSQSVFSFVLTTANHHTFTVSEQASPQNFSDIPTLYTKLLDGLNQFDTVSTFNGTLTLTRPSGGGEAGVLNDKGVLMFIRSASGSVSKDEWKQVTEMLDIDKLNN